MKEYSVRENFLFFDEIGTDSLGKNYRVGPVENNKAKCHNLLTEVNPRFTSSSEMWKQITFLVDGVQKAKIRNLYCPEKVVEEKDHTYLLYPFLKSKSLQQILADVVKTDVVMDLDLTFSIAIALADVLEMSSSIIVNKKKSFHGLLTADNIFIDYDGRVLLKNYGLFPYLKRNPELINAVKQAYTDQLSPEFMQQDTFSRSSDVYSMGNIIFCILTGQFYKQVKDAEFEEDLRAKAEGFLHLLPTEDPEYQKNLIIFLSKTLNPDPMKRFVDMKEIKDFIAQDFHVAEVSSATFIIAYFMNLLYMKNQDEDSDRLIKELAYTIPVKKEAAPIHGKAADDHSTAEILQALEAQKSSKSKLIFGMVAVFIVIVGIAIFVIISQQKQAKNQQEIQSQARENLEQSMAKIKLELEAEYRKRLEAIEKKNVATDEERKSREEEIKKLKEWRDNQEKLRNIQAAAKPEPAKKTEHQPQPTTSTQTQTQTLPQTKEQTPPIVVPEEKKPEVIEKKEEKKPETPTIKTGDLVPIESVTIKPNRLSGKSNVKAAELKFSKDILKLYEKQPLTVYATLLVDHIGSVIDVKLPTYMTDEMKSKVAGYMKTWEFIPAEKDKIKVKVWYPVKIVINFE